MGAGGSQLSGGQKQRIAIARAIIKNPQILILDEATSALDRRNERSIQQTLERLARTMTTITIAHKLETIRSADHILVIRKGTVLAQGTFESLYRDCEWFRGCYDKQASKSSHVLPD